jgi:excinuclease ABC subunit C
VERAEKLLAGNTEGLIADLKVQMHKEAHNLRFERAADLRNAIEKISSLNGEVSVVDFDSEGRDYIAWAADGVLASFAVFNMREGKMTGRNLYRARSAADEEDTVESFMTAYYTPRNLPPAAIYMQALETKSLLPNIKRWFREAFGREPEILIPSDKHHEAILAMVRENASEDLRKRLKERGAGPALDELARVLKLPVKPERIEGFDIAQLDGQHPVASLISFNDGIPDKKNYRHFKLRTTIGIVDDFASMREAVSRRYKRLLKEETETGISVMPDLILVDGGIGQVNAAKGVLDELGLSDIPVAGLAKRDEEIWLPQAKEPVVLSRRSEALKVLQAVRDETHRFATGLNQKLRSTAALRFPVLESIEGVGPRRAAMLMTHYGSLEALAAASPQEIADDCGLGKNAAIAVHAALGLTLKERDAEKKRLSSVAGTRHSYASPGSSSEDLATRALED